ncbi:DNA-binding transcriptional regulator, IclR family [Raineyella antarctica]|uniref:DNA-binding transcriptional regulator, IclR family n=1 Tax=Raineyella antarctica TaxID=1577474 RepID=A0A1G6I4V5_9ACTN|nr:IclR family transcriptional regulator [Raineyella antarctica]SDC01413.1 DNA-binding transcriptional regulator, IclR family [Raineyella antarctica]
MVQKSEAVDPYRIEAVDRALVLLSMLSERSQLSVTEAARELGVAPSTAHRLLATLAGRGYVRQGGHRLYHPGPALFVAGGLERSVSRVTARLHPVLEQLHVEVGETIHLQMLAGADAQFVDGVEGDQGLRVGLRGGIRMPAYCTSGGKAMLAALPDPVIEAVHSRGLRPWPSARITSLDELWAELAEVRECGYALNRDESERGVVAIGVAIAVEAGDPVASVAVAIPSPRFEDSSIPYLVASLGEARDAAIAILRGASTG